MDFYFNEDGDIQQSANGDIATTPTVWRDQVQQAYIRLMTDVGDFLLYPQMGASLSRLYGMPQSPATGNFGTQLIMNALTTDGTFTTSQVSVKAVPTGYQTIRFDVSLISGSLQQLTLSLEQNLGIT